MFVGHLDGVPFRKGHDAAESHPPVERVIHQPTTVLPVDHPEAPATILRRLEQELVRAVAIEVGPSCRARFEAPVAHCLEHGLGVFGGVRVRCQV